MTESREIRRHYDMLDRLPLSRSSAEWVLRISTEKGNEIPASMEVEAALEAHTIDTFLPILIQRARRLGPVATIDTLRIISNLNDDLKATTPPTIGARR